MKRRIKVRERKLGRERAWGFAYHGENVVEIDPRHRSRQYLDTLIQELLHLSFPAATEHKIRLTARTIAGELWRKRYRRIEK